MRIILAPDSFKGSLSATTVAAAMERGVQTVFPQAQIVKIPVADGGEGTVEALVCATNGTLREEKVLDPLGRPIKACWGVLGDGETAVIEMAAASGLPLLSPEQRNPCATSTFGTGQLVRAALDRGLRRIIMGIGGSATNDGGAGFASALGVRFLNSCGTELPPGGGALAELADIDCAGLDKRLKEVELIVACDVDNPLCGPSGASHIFGPQKGASPETIPLLDEALRHYGRILGHTAGHAVMDTPGSGAAGGLGAALLAFTGATLKPGIEIVLKAVDFDRIVTGAALVITGEGHSDAQTAFGKAPVGVARIAKRHGVPVACLSGGLGEGYQSLLQHGIDVLQACPHAPMTLERCMEDAEELIAMASERLCRTIQIGMNMC